MKYKYLLTTFALAASLQSYSAPISKAEACGYVKVSRATFDRLVKEGRLPKGRKRKGWTELVWYEKDLDKYIDKLI